jgi:ankyrin repeat protein
LWYSSDSFGKKEQLGHNRGVVEAGADVNLEATSGRLRTPLIAVAAEITFDNLEVLQYLIRGGAGVRNVLTKSVGVPSFSTGFHESKPGSPLLAAIQCGSSVFQIEIAKTVVEIFLDSGASEDINRFVEVDDFGTPLIAAAALGLSDTVDLLLERGALCSVVGHPDVDWRLPSLAAAYGRQPELALKLLEMENYSSVATEALAWAKCFVFVCAQGDPNASPDSGWNRLSSELLNHEVDVTFQLVELPRFSSDSSTINEVAACGTAIIAACMSGQQSLVMALIENGAAEYPSSAGNYGACLAAACSSGNVELVRYFLDRNHDPNHASPTALCWCPLVAAASSEDWNTDEIVRLLLDRGANADIQYHWANTALTTQDVTELVFKLSKTWHHALLLGRMWETSVITGSSFAESFPFFGTPLIAAAAEGNLDPMMTLAEKGANPGKVVNVGLYPSAMIASYDRKKGYRIANPLSNAGVTTPAASEVLKYVRSFGFITPKHIQESPKLAIPGSFWGNILMASVKAGLALPFLLEQGIHPDEAVPGSFYGTAMIAASALLESTAVSLFLENGSDVNSSTIHGAFGTPLIALCTGPPAFPYNYAFNTKRSLEDDEQWEHTQLDLLEEFLNRGARPNVSHRGLSPLIALACCSSSKTQYGVELLLRHGADPYLYIPRYSPQVSF